MKTTTLIMLLALALTIYLAKKHLYNPIHSHTDAIAKILEQRHSGYSFDPQKHVTREQIKSLIRAAQLAPSSYNEQPWNFIICDKTTSPDAYNKTFSTLVEFNQNWAKNAQILVVITASNNSHKNNEPNLWAQYDTGSAAFSMAIQATALGLMTHQMAGFDSEKVIELLNIPKDVMPISIMAIGYEDTSKSNHKPRERKPVGENFFQANWGLANNNWK